MLDGLDDIDWSSLEHAFGPADDVPELLRGLISPEKDVRDDALGELFGNVWHQGTVYSATPHVVPFLVEILEQDAAPDREGVITLFALIAAGSGYLEVHAASEQRAKEWSAILRREGRDFEEELGKERRTVAFVRDACLLHLGLLLPYLASSEPDVRTEVARALAKYPENREVFLPLVEAALAAETDEEARESLEESAAALRGE